MRNDKLKLYNIGWDARAKQPNTGAFNTTYNQIGNKFIFAYSALEAYDIAADELEQRFKKDLSWINTNIVFVEEVSIAAGAVKYREMTYSDYNKHGDCFNSLI